LQIRITVMDSSDENGAALSTKLTVDDVDVEFLPLIYEIIRRYEARRKSVCRRNNVLGLSHVGHISVVFELPGCQLVLFNTIVLIDPCVLY